MKQINSKNKINFYKIKKSRCKKNSKIYSKATIEPNFAMKTQSMLLVSIFAFLKPNKSKFLYLIFSYLIKMIKNFDILLTNNSINPAEFLETILNKDITNDTTKSSEFENVYDDYFS